MHNPMNRNPEENRPLDPFAAAEAPVHLRKVRREILLDMDVSLLEIVFINKKA